MSSDKDFKQLRQVLEQVVEAYAGKTREIERAMGLGSGNLGKLLDGRLEIKLRHLVGLAEFLEVPPMEFLELGFPELNRNARFHLAEWLGPRRAAVYDAGGLPKSTEDLRELIRQVLREELAGDAPAPKTGARTKRSAS